MIEYLKTWLNGIQQNYGVNPIIFAIIYFASIIPFWFSIYKIIAGLKNRNLNQVRTFGIILGIIIILPFTYVALFGHNLPFWFWIVAACVIGYSTYSTIRRIKSAK
ncbi:hypothetical protein ES705_27615 [subsurface metagenome]